MARTASELTPWEIINVQELNDIANSKYVYKDSSGIFTWVSAVSLSWYTVTNVTTDRSYNADSTTIDELADVLGTVISDISILGAWVGDMVLADVQTVTWAKTFGTAWAVGKLKIAGATSWSVTIDTSAIAGTAVITIPAVTDTLVGKDTTDTLTNKTLTSPILTTPALGTASSWNLSNCSFWNLSATWSSWAGLTLTKQSGATYNLDLQTDYDGSPSMRLYRNAIWTTNTFANIDFNSKLDDGTANRNFSAIYWYTISQASAASYNWGLAYLFTNSGSGNYKFGMDYLWRFSVGDYAWNVTEGGTNWLLFSSGTAATISNATRGYLYNNSGTLTWVNSGSDNQFALIIPASALWIIGETITVNNTQSNAQIWLKVDVWTSTLDHNTLYLTGTRHSVYIGNADQAPAVTTNKLYSVWWNLFWNGTQLN